MSLRKEATKSDVDVSSYNIGDASESTTTPSLSTEFRALWICKRASFAALACSSAAVLIGYDMTLIGSIIANTEFVKHFGTFDISKEEWILPADVQLIWSLVQYVCAMIGAIGSGQLSDMFGRRILFYILVTCTMVGTITELFSPDWKVWLIAKILFGTAMGLMQGTIPAYVAELAPSHIRGFLLSMFQFWIMFGSFIAACVMEGTTHTSGPWSWKGPIVSQLILGSACLILFAILVPESPYYLVQEKRFEKAGEALRTLRGSEPTYDAEIDLSIITRTLARNEDESGSSITYLECFKGTDLRRTALACLPMVMQHFLGCPLCGNYLAYFLTRSGVTNAFTITLISLLLAILAVMCAFVLIEKAGRRPQYLFGTFAVLPCLLAIGILGFQTQTVPILKAVSALCIIWSFVWYLSVGAVGWTFVGEISSSRLRPKTTSIAAMVNSLVNMGWSIAIPYLVNVEYANLGPKTALVFFAPSTFFAILVFFVMPETKGKTYQKLDELFESRTPARKF